ncbi:fructose-bisphosphate aldolase 6, cytosolic-like [Eucalyptus grandis]|uniref:fructose-bisphosphate aldolase 6, cytosolic-like n=1 Tax=Eucalyptus grandis TaxID=71139 RepID=UPI00192EA624|nr:fructose-bisphosphate aldolase 6, cytosolic-like [Eucalyptus grandis]
MSCQKGKYHDELIAIADHLGTPGKGILVAEESTGTISKQSFDINVEDVESQKGAILKHLFAKSKDFTFLSGVILDEETLLQKPADGKPFVDILKEGGALAGIKVDKGTVELASTNGETTTQGLDGLAERCQQYYAAGARFAIWRAVFKIGPNEPSQLAVNENANGLARFAIICQENGLVPIVEPEILVDGSHGINKCAEVTERVLVACYKALHDHHVLVEGTLLQTNMVTPGSEAYKLPPDIIAEYTVLAMLRTVPAVVPAVLFLASGQSEGDAVLNLNAMNKPKSKKPRKSLHTTSKRIVKKPWSLSFSFGQAPQQSILKAWDGMEENFPKAQAALLRRCKVNSEAALGTYKGTAQLDEEAVLRTYKGKAKLVEGTSGSHDV